MIASHISFVITICAITVGHFLTRLGHERFAMSDCIEQANSAVIPKGFGLELDFLRGIDMVIGFSCLPPSLESSTLYSPVHLGAQL